MTVRLRWRKGEIQIAVLHEIGSAAGRKTGMERKTNTGMKRKTNRALI
jgi:hypothetical protein